MSRRVTPKPIALGVLLTFAALGPGHATAELISLDLFAPGDGLLTRDTGRGMEWLDLYTSRGFSWDEIEAGAGGFQDLGFRHATEAEVMDLFTQVGVSASGYPPSTANYQPIVDMLFLLGCGPSACYRQHVANQGFIDEITYRVLDPNRYATAISL